MTDLRTVPSGRKPFYPTLGLACRGGVACVVSLVALTPAGPRPSGSGAGGMAGPPRGG